MTSYYNDNYQTPELNNNPGVAAESRLLINARIPAASISQLTGDPIFYRTRDYITADNDVLVSVDHPIMVPEVAPTFFFNLYGYPYYIQNTSVQEPNIQAPYIQECYTQNPYLQYLYMQQLNIQQPYYIQQPYVHQLFAQQPYVQQAYTQNPSMQSPYLTEPYLQESYTTADVINDLHKCILGDLVSPGQTTEDFNNKSEHSDPFEAYLKLPKDLFPTVDKLGLDPNPLIDQFCKLEDVYEHAPWLLDLELGVPISPPPRTIAMYDFKNSSIVCKHKQNIIHPGFQKCNNDFQKLLLMYYKNIINSRYKGYKIFYKDQSLQNFEAWLSLPMHTYGLYWP